MSDLQCEYDCLRSKNGIGPHLGHFILHTISPLFEEFWVPAHSPQTDLQKATLSVFHLSWWNYVLMISLARGKLFEADAFGLGMKIFAPSAYLHCIFLRDLDQCLRHTHCGCLLFRLFSASYKGTNLRNLLTFSYLRHKCHVLQIVWVLGYLKSYPFP